MMVDCWVERWVCEYPPSGSVEDDCDVCVVSSSVWVVEEHGFEMGGE